ncbi:hypothetical protein SALBM311S_12811 [Streptomyces alboniger]
MFVCQPLFQNPTGAVLAPERRGEVLGIARAAGAFVVEDDFVRRLVHEDAGPVPRPLAADDPDGVVVHVGSLTKATSPSFRVSALAARGPVLERLRAIQVVDSFFVPRPLQEAALELVGSPAWPRHLRAISAELKARRDVMTAALRLGLPDLSLPHIPSGGYHLWLRLPDGTGGTAQVFGSGGEAALTAAALRAGCRDHSRPPVLQRRAVRRTCPPELRGGGGSGGDRGGGTASSCGVRRGGPGAGRAGGPDDSRVTPLDLRTGAAHDRRMHLRVTFVAAARSSPLLAERFEDDHARWTRPAGTRCSASSRT